MFLRSLSTLFLAAAAASPAGAPALRINPLEYFEMPGLNVIAFQDYYPEGHQAGVTIIQNGVRVAANGDLRLGATPGQWQPVAGQGKRVVDREHNEIAVTLSYPDPKRNRQGFNPIDYPDLTFNYTVHVCGVGPEFRIVVDLDRPLPATWIGKVGFNLELYPAALFGKTWYMDSRSGIFPRQPNGPDVIAGGAVEPVPLAEGRRLSVAPEVDAQRLIIESRTGNLQLVDARNTHNDGWFVVRSLVPAGATAGAIEWTVKPNALPNWKYGPVAHVSEVGYHPAQKKVAVIELDRSETGLLTARVERVRPEGGFEEVLAAKPVEWQGSFLRYRYALFDFTSVTRPGMYVIEYGGFRSEPFQISPEVYRRHVWQPVLDQFLPVQMCHMRVEEQYRVWHGACHLDDARMAPVNHNHFDGYRQGPSTLTKYQPGESVPGLNVGGWHDAGDDDLRIESQADEVHILAMAYELFSSRQYDDTSVDQQRRLVRIHVPDGKPDLLEQVEQGVLTILGGYHSLGRVYRGMVTSTLRQYVITGDWANVTDNLFYQPSLGPAERTATHSGLKDDRWVFTEENPSHEYKAVAALAIAGRVLKEYKAELAKECVEAAEGLWSQPRDTASRRAFPDRIAAAAELWLTTNKPVYGQVLLDSRKEILARIGQAGWALGRVLPRIEDAGFVEELNQAVAQDFARTVDRMSDNPFGVPYRPRIWGAGWDIQEFGVRQYLLHRAFPKLVPPDYALNALNFVLGVHPGSNTASFASGVGARSMTIAYGINRNDYSYIPGGVASGTALIRPDFPELKDFPYLWQQGEYVLGGGSSNMMFLAMAADDLLNRSEK